MMLASASLGNGAVVPIVSENSEADIARHSALARVEWRLRELAANLLRIIRGAGKPTR
jgi:hypothetical protein